LPLLLRQSFLLEGFLGAGSFCFCAICCVRNLFEVQCCSLGWLEGSVLFVRSVWMWWLKFGDWVCILFGLSSAMMAFVRWW
jgi:hypothetical protein